jgi:hypothetical protein
MPLLANAQLSISSPDTEVTITFDETLTGVSNGQFLGTGIAAEPAAGQLDSDAWSVIGLSDGDTDFGGDYSSGDYARGASTGGTGSGGLYAFDISGSGSNYAFGVQPTGSDFSSDAGIRLRVINNTGAEVNTVKFKYELWVNNDGTRSNSFNGVYSLDNSTYTEVTELNYTSPEASDANGWTLNTKEAIITLSTPVASGDFIYVGWNSNDIGGSSARDEFALNNIAVTVNPEGSANTDPNISLALNEFVADFGEVFENNISISREYSIVGLNLTEDLTLTVPDQFEISTNNGQTYSAETRTFTAVDGKVNQTIFVRFAPTTAGTHSGDLVHTSSGITERLTINGLALAGDGLIITEDFESCPENLPEGWTIYSAGSDKNWACNENGRGQDSQGMQINGYNSDVDSDDWLISPTLNMDEYPAEEFYFWARTRFSGNPIQVKYSTDYTNDPTTATWTDITVYNLPEENSDVWTKVAADLSDVTGTLNIAFHYTGTPTGSARWTIDDVSLFSGDDIIEFASISALRNVPGGADATFRLTDEAVLTYQQNFRNQKFIQDATAGILIDDSGKSIASTYEIGDGISNIVGKITEFRGMLQFVPSEDPGEPTSTNNEPVIPTITISQLANNFEDYESRLVRIEGLSFTETGTFANGTAYGLTNGTDTYNFRTTFYNVDYTGTPLPENSFTLVGIPNSDANGEYLTARNLADFDIDEDNSTTVVLIDQDFDDCQLNSWSTFSITGAQEWRCAENNGTNGTNGYQMSGFASGSNNVNEDWLISPAFNADEFESEILNFMARTRFPGEQLEILYSVDYDGSSEPTGFTWVIVPNVNLPETDTDEWTAVTGDLSSVVGNLVYVAFKYTSDATSSARWTLDDIEITAEATGAVATLDISLDGFNGDFGGVNVGETSSVSVFNLIGSNLTEDVVITAPEGFEVSTNGTDFSNLLTVTQSGGSATAQISIRFMPTEATSYAGTIELASGIARGTVPVSGNGLNEGGGEGINSVAELRQQAVGGTYTLSSEAILTYQQSFRSQKYIQDETAGILIDDNGGVITTTYSINDGITGLTGTLSEFGGMLQFVPTQDPGEATSSNNTPTVTEVTLAELSANFEDYEGQLVRVRNVAFDDAGTFANGTVYGISDATSSYNFRTTFFNVDYIGSEVPNGSITLVGIPNSRNDGEYLSARNSQDFETPSGGTGEVFLTENFDDCDITGWSTVSVSGDQEWRCVETFGNNGTGGYQMSGFASGSSNVNEDWLITPVLNLSGAENVRLTFMARTRFSGESLQVVYSTEYDGTSTPDIANWTAVPGIALPAIDSDVWTEVTGDLSGINNNEAVYIAFVYASTSDASARWTLDDVVVESPSNAIITTNLEGFTTDFGTVAVGLASEVSQFTVSATKANNLVIQASEGFELSLNGTSFSEQIVLEGADDVVAETTVFVRFNPARNDNFAGSITLTSGTTEQTIDMVGTGYSIVNLADFSGSFGELIEGGESSIRSYTIALYNTTENVEVNAPEGFLVSTDSENFSNSLTLSSNADGDIQATVYVKFVPTAVGTYSGEITNTLGSASNSVLVSGTAVVASVTVFAENFDDCFADWQVVSISSDKNWVCADDSRFGWDGNFAEMNGFRQDEKSVDYLISPAIDMDAQEDELLSFVSEYFYGDDNTIFELRYSTDYDGTGTKEAVEEATWQTIDFTKPADRGEWTKAVVDLSSITGNAYLAFYYEAEANPRRWRIDDLKVYYEVAETLAGVRTLNANGMSIYNGVEVTVNGVVHGLISNVSGNANAVEFRLVDVQEEVGITVRYNGTDALAAVSEGDLITVTGKVSSEMGLTVLNPTEMAVSSSANQLLPAIGLEGTMLSESQESLPVRIEAALVTGGWEQVIDGIYYVTLEKNGTEYTVRFDSELADWSGIMDADALTLNGFGYQMDESMPYDDGYMITVLGLDDVDILNSLEDDVLKQSVSLYPNPSQGGAVFFKGLTEPAIVIITDVTGRVISTQAVQSSQVAVSQLASGIYHLTLTTNKAKATYRLVKQ